MRLAADYAKRAENGEVPAFADLPTATYDGDEFIRSSAGVLRSVLADLGDETPTVGRARSTLPA